MLNEFADEIHRRLMNILFDIQKQKSVMTATQYQEALKRIDKELGILGKEGWKGMKTPTEKVFMNTIEWVGTQNGIGLSMNTPDRAVMTHFQNEYFPPAFERMTTGETPYNYKNTVNRILTLSLDEHWNWTKTIREMDSYLSTQGKNFPRWMHERVIRSELSRFVTEGHIRGHKKLGFKRFRRLETEDEKTNVDLCLPYNNTIYDADEASGIIPAHPNCRGDMTPEPNKEAK